MQRPGQHPVRPLPIQGQPDLQQLLELARASGMQQSRSAFSTVPGGAAPFPEFSLYNAAQLSGLLGNNAGVQLDQLAQIQQLQNLQSQAGAAALLGSGQAVPESSTSRNSAGKGVSRGDKSSSAYASRHQAAEQRRRTRINDRLERLRQVVPHSERANTATFLEEVIKYVEALQGRVTELETAQGLPLSCLPLQKQVPIPQAWAQPVPARTASQDTTPPATAALATPALPAGLQGPQFSAQAQAAAPAALPQQKDRPETPPQNQSKSEEESEGASQRQPSPETVSEGTAAKRQRLESSAS